MFVSRKTKNLYYKTAQCGKVYETSMINPVYFCEDYAKPADSSKVKFYMDTNIVFVNSSCNSLMLHNQLNWYGIPYAALIYDLGKIIGMVTKEHLDQIQVPLAGRPVGSVAIPWEQVKTINSNDSIDCTMPLFGKGTEMVVVLHNQRPVGVLLKEVAKAALNHERLQTGRMQAGGLRQMLDLFPEGLLVLNANQNVIYYNKQLLKLFGQYCVPVLGRKFEYVFGWLFAGNHRDFLKKCCVQKVLEDHLTVTDVECKTYSGQRVLINCYPIVRRKNVKYLVLNFRDITPQQNQETWTFNECEELAHTFRLMLPNNKIEERLKAIPEYKDQFDHNTGLSEIVEIIPGGAYGHVINCLKIISELQEKGVFEVSGIDRNIVVQALILHDVGKEQPKLNVGDVIDPKVAFADGKVHARESARVVSRFPEIVPEIVKLVKYHHHEEHELPKSFPANLLPMLRLVCLVDGLSAGVTRRGAEINLTMEGDTILVFEKNANAIYNGIRKLDLVTGEVMFHRF